MKKRLFPKNFNSIILLILVPIIISDCQPPQKRTGIYYPKSKTFKLLAKDCVIDRLHINNGTSSSSWRFHVDTCRNINIYDFIKKEHPDVLPRFSDYSSIFVYCRTDSIFRFSFCLTCKENYWQKDSILVTGKGPLRTGL
jgi:hypothetical protein